ncbi:serine/threonine protein kinase [Plasmodium reichenowi]|uniref:Serine/threonine protein kinase n=1 Tax=Plasmodium reichenowi TaxID=5854 RepID=A0A060RZH6_PLARE|nr:serine/threonine protein kinase [Plasmodium reichenowi]
MSKTEYDILSLVNAVEEFSKYCSEYKKRHLTNYIQSDSINNQINNNEEVIFKTTLQDFMNKVNMLGNNILQIEKINKCQIPENILYEKNGNKMIYDPKHYNEDKLNNENILEDKNKRNICEHIKSINDKNFVQNNDYGKNIKIINNINEQNLLMQDKNDYINISENSYMRKISTEYTSSDRSSEDNVLLHNINNVLVKYVSGLDYTLNIRRISRKDLIQEIKQFYIIHNSNIQLNDYSTYLSDEVINILKQKKDNIKCLDKNNLFIIEKNDDFYKNNFLPFFYIPCNYLFIKNYCNDNERCLETTYDTNDEKNSTTENSYILSSPNHMYNTNTNSYNSHSNSIIARNTSSNKCNSPIFGINERNSSPNFGIFNESIKNDKDQYNMDPNYLIMRYNLNEEVHIKDDRVINSPNNIKSMNDNRYNSPNFNIEHIHINNNDTQINNYDIYDINNMDGKKNNLNSNTSDFYQSISDFYKNNEKNLICQEQNNNNTYMQKCAFFLNSNETNVLTNNKNHHKSGKNLISLCFDDELSSAITINNDSSLNKGIYNEFNNSEKDIVEDICNTTNYNDINMEHMNTYQNDERKWMDEYCNGDYNLFRSKQLKKKKELLLSCISYNEKENKYKDQDNMINVEINNDTKIKNILYDTGNISFDENIGINNHYNTINLKVIYEANKSEYGNNERLNFIKGQIILNKYKVVKILSKTQFSTTLKCLNLLYKKVKTDTQVFLPYCHKYMKEDSEITHDKKENNYDKFVNLNTIKKKNENYNRQHDIKNNLHDNKHQIRNNKKKVEPKYVCLKVMKNGKQFLDQGLLELMVLNILCNENTNNNLSNKNIIQLYDSFYYKEHLIIVTEYMQSDLYNYFIRKGKLGTLGQLQILTKNLLEGLAYIHSKNLIHCDLKPENIMINMKKNKKNHEKGKYNKVNQNGDNIYNDTIEPHILNSSNINISNLEKKNIIAYPSFDQTFIENKDTQYDNNEKTSNVLYDIDKSYNNNVKNMIDNNLYCNNIKNIDNNNNNNNNNNFPHNNINIYNTKQFDKIKIIDFNSCIYESDKLEMYIQTRSYRSPEVLLQQNYDRKIDIWSLGCILFEFLTKKILFDYQNIYRFIYSIVSYIGPFPFYMINNCRIPHIFTKHGLIILKKFTTDNMYENYIKEEQLNQEDDEEIVFNSNDFFRLNKKDNIITKDLLKNKNPNISIPRKRNNNNNNNEVYYDVCYPSDNLLKNNFQISDTLFVDFLSSLLQIDPSKRFNAMEALKHPWLQPNLYKDGL